MSYPEDAGALALVAYEQLAPLHLKDAERGYPLLKFLDAYYLPMQQVYDIIRDYDDLPGWGILLDPDRCPVRYLPWCGLWAGVRVDPAVMSEAEMRARIKARDGQQRCTPAAIIKAAQDNLVSSDPLRPPRVILRERYDPDNPGVDSPGHFEVLTYTGETPDADAVLVALRQQKDVGLLMHYRVIDGQDWQQLVNNYATWQDVLNAYPTWQDVIEDTPA